MVEKLKRFENKRKEDKLTKTSNFLEKKRKQCEFEQPGEG
jgi:hypothetical protein